MRTWRRSGPDHRPWLLIVSIAGVWLLCMNVGAWLLSRPLEMWYDDDPIPAETAEAIVVLAGAVNPATRIRPYPLAGQDTYRRVQHGVWLFQHWKRLPILASGGGKPDAPHAEIMRRMLIAEGIPADRVWTESRSSNTYESALYGAEILRRNNVSRIVLVTEASSMPRAAYCFRRQGLYVVPAPARFNRLGGTPRDFLPGWAPLASNGETVHEIVGLAWYKLRGWI